jgi:hypothetical protein
MGTATAVALASAISNAAPPKAHLLTAGTICQTCRARFQISRNSDQNAHDRIDLVTCMAAPDASGMPAGREQAFQVGRLRS